MFSFWKKSKEEIFDFSLLQTDMHSHLIPGIDDGAPDLETALDLIKALSDLGYKKLITTPHIIWDIYRNTPENILQGLKGLQNSVIEAQIDIKIAVAAEYFLDDHFKELLDKKEPLLTIKDNMVLVEFSMANEPIGLKEILFDMQLQGYQPVIAHPERYSYNARNQEFFASMKSSGYMFQLNILSLVGLYGRLPQVMARNFIKNNYYELVGTDLHNHLHLRILEDSKFSTELKRLLDSGKIINSGI